MPSTRSIVALSALAASATAETIKINVGKGGLMFDPPSVTAKVGDILEYHYFPKAHSVVQGDFKKGCSPSEGGFNSGFVPTTEGENEKVFQVEVKDTKPIWFYCSQGMHCQNGMVGAVNPTKEKTLDAYKANAEKAGESVTPDQVTGGKLVKAGEGGQGGDGSWNGGNSTSGGNPPYGGGSETGSAGGSTPTGSTGGDKGGDSGNDGKATGTLVTAPTGSGSGAPASTNSDKPDSAAGKTAAGSVAALVLGVSGLLML